MKMTKEKKIDIIVYFIMCFMSFIFVYFCSGSTSPIIERYYGDDSAMFQVIGKSWSRGIIPYIGTFDHKGPFIFFVNMLGYLIGNYGMIIVQGTFMSFTFFGLYKLSRLFIGIGLSIVVTICSYVVLLNTYGFGNYTEEYSLLFIVYSLYLGLKFFLSRNDQGVKVHPWIYSIWYGISFMCIFLMRLTSALAICCVILVILVQLIMEKQWLCIFQNIIGFLGGCMVIMIPFSIYFGYYNAWYDMIYGTILHNILYAEQSSIFLEGVEWRPVYITLFTDGLLLIVSVIHLIICKKKKMQVAVLGVLLSILSGAMFFKMNRYLHYYMIILPYFILSAGIVASMHKEKRNTVINKIVVSVTMCLVGMQVVFSISRIQMQKHMREVFQGYAQAYVECADTIMKYVPEEEKSDVLVFGSNAFSQMYLVEDIDPNYKYCMLQGWMSSCSDEIKSDVKKYLQKSPAKWLIVEADVNTEKIAENHCHEIADIIQDRYQLIDTEKMENDGLCFQLYELVD